MQHSVEERHPVYYFGPFEYEPSAATVVHSEGQSVRLTPRENEILRLIAEAFPGSANKEDIYIKLLASGKPEPKIVDVMIRKIRAKLGTVDERGNEYIVTLWGSGYKLSNAPLRASFAHRQPNNLVRRMNALYSAAFMR